LGFFLAQSGVRQAIHDVMRFGFARVSTASARCDLALITDAEFRDDPSQSGYREGRPPHEKV